jgi:dipeptidase E
VRLLLLSNSRNLGQGYLQHAEDDIRSFLGTTVRRVLFVPFAAVRISYDDFTAFVRARFRELGYEVDGVHQQREPRAAVSAAEAVVVGGGNTWHLLRALYETDVLEAVRERALAGVPYLGWSAGANVAGPTIKTTNDMPVVEPPSFDALGLVPFQINPHYTDERIPNHGGETRAERLLEFVAANPGVPVVGLREGSAIRIEGATLALLGPHAARLFVSGREPAEYQPGDALPLLLG